MQSGSDNLLLNVHDMANNEALTKKLLDKQVTLICQFAYLL